MENKYLIVKKKYLSIKGGTVSNKNVETITQAEYDSKWSLIGTRGNYIKNKANTFTQKEKIYNEKNNNINNGVNIEPINIPDIPDTDTSFIKNKNGKYTLKTLIDNNSNFKEGINIEPEYTPDEQFAGGVLKLFSKSKSEPKPELDKNLYNGVNYIKNKNEKYTLNTKIYNTQNNLNYGVDIKPEFTPDNITFIKNKNGNYTLKTVIDNEIQKQVNIDPKYIPYKDKNFAINKANTYTLETLINQDFINKEKFSLEIYKQYIDVEDFLETNVNFFLYLDDNQAYFKNINGTYTISSKINENDIIGNPELIRYNDNKYIQFEGKYYKKFISSVDYYNNEKTFKRLYKRNKMRQWFKDKRQYTFNLVLYTDEIIKKKYDEDIKKQKEIMEKEKKKVPILIDCMMITENNQDLRQIIYDCK